MIIDLPSTSSSALNRKMVDMREQGGTLALSRVLTLVIVTDESGSEESIEAANEASFEHPCRVIVIARGSRRGSARMDAQIRVGGDAGASEVIVVRLYGELADHGAAIVVPLLLPDAPLVAWWPQDPPDVPSEDPIGALAKRRITDSAHHRRPLLALERRLASYAPGDTDLAWTRLTSWRGLLAAALDLPPREKVTSAMVAGAVDSASADLLAGWLALQLRCPVRRLRAGVAGSGLHSVELTRKSGVISLVRPQSRTATLSAPGQPDRHVALPRRTLRDCIAEELRRLDADEVYAEVLGKGLAMVDRQGAGPRAGASASAKAAPSTRARATPVAKPGTGARVGASTKSGTGAKTGVASKTAKTSVTRTPARSAGPRPRSPRRRRPRSPQPPLPAPGPDAPRRRLGGERRDGRAGQAQVGRWAIPMTPQVVIHASAEMLAATTAARLVTRLVDLQSAGRIPAIALTGGGSGISTLTHLANSPAVDAVDWRRVEIFWGDERFVPVDDPERNDKQAREALLDRVDVDPARIHAMAASDGDFGEDVDAAAEAYASLLDARDGFDVVMLGLGGEGHVASIFPESPAVYDDRTVVAVRNCPKPPPTRISLTLPTIRTAAEVWIITGGAEKAGAVALALGGAGEVALPAAGAVGRSRTLWLLDREAASQLPAALSRIPLS